MHGWQCSWRCDAMCVSGGVSCPCLGVRQCRLGAENGNALRLALCASGLRTLCQTDGRTPPRSAGSLSSRSACGACTCWSRCPAGFGLQPRAAPKLQHISLQLPKGPPAIDAPEAGAARAPHPGQHGHAGGEGSCPCQGPHAALRCHGTIAGPRAHCVAGPPSNSFEEA
jgi:hypothetical protein